MKFLLLSLCLSFSISAFAQREADSLSVDQIVTKSGRTIDCRLKGIYQFTVYYRTVNDTGRKFTSLPADSIQLLLPGDREGLTLVHSQKFYPYNRTRYEALRTKTIASGVRKRVEVAMLYGLSYMSSRDVFTYVGHPTVPLLQVRGAFSGKKGLGGYAWADLRNYVVTPGLTQYRYRMITGGLGLAAIFPIRMFQRGYASVNPGLGFRSYQAWERNIVTEKEDRLTDHHFVPVANLQAGVHGRIASIFHLGVELGVQSPLNQYSSFLRDTRIQYMLSVSVLLK